MLYANYHPLGDFVQDPATITTHTNSSSGSKFRAQYSTNRLQPRKLTAATIIRSFAKWTQSRERPTNCNTAPLCYALLCFESSQVSRGIASVAAMAPYDSPRITIDLSCLDKLRAAKWGAVFLFCQLHFTRLLLSGYLLFVCYFFVRSFVCLLARTWPSISLLRTLTREFEIKTTTRNGPTFALTAASNRPAARNWFQLAANDTTIEMEMEMEIQPMRTSKCGGSEALAPGEWLMICNCDHSRG